MGSIGDPITPAIPAVGAAGPQFATDLNSILTEVVARLSTKVPNSSINFSTGQDMQGSNILNAGYLTLVNAVSTPSGSPANRLTAFAGDLWYVSPSSAIQLTSGSTLNAAGIGGITGSYGGANPAQFRYDAVNTRYDAFANFGTNTWAYVRGLGFDIAASATSSVFARLQLTAGAVSNITYSLPASLPAATSFLSLQPSGNIVTTPTGGTVNYSVTSVILNTGITFNLGLGYPTLVLGTSTAISFLPFSIPVGSTITSWTVYVRKTSASGQISASGTTALNTTGALGSFGTTQINSANNPGFIQLTNSGLSVVTAANTAYGIEITGGGVTGDSVVGYAVTYV